MAPAEKLVIAARPQRYTFGRKVKAFGRGLLEGAPLLRIAEEGLGRHILSPRLAEAYIKRLMLSLNCETRLGKAFGPEMPEWAQERIARRLEFGIKYMPLQAADCMSIKNELGATIIWLEMRGVREQIADALYEGRVTSQAAQTTLAKCFEEADGGLNSKYLAELRGRVASEKSKASEETKALIREISAMETTDPAA